MPCAKGCSYLVHEHRDNPADPAYPIVVCPICMTRWNGHREDADTKPFNAKLPAALRDAIILDQAEEAFRILEDELGYSKAVRPNAILGAGSDTPILPTQSVQITVRPQCASFLPTHFVVGSDGFVINDVRVGLHSMFLQARDIPSEAFRATVSPAPELRLRPGEVIGGAFVEILNADQLDFERLPSACSSFKWRRCRTAMEIIVVATHVSQEPRPFYSWFLGRQSDKWDADNDE